MGIRSGACVLALVAAVVVQSAVPAGADDVVTYRPPVDAPISDPFRPPKSAYGPGNRGLTYELPPGTPVHAAAPGRVVFAGWVAGTRHVTVLHADGLRTSYSFLESVVVRRGVDVSAGDIVGTGGVGFHFGVRDGDVYLDPASLFGVVEVRVRLVPHDEPRPPTDEGLLRERIALTRTVREKGLVRRAVEWGTDLAERRVERALGTVHVLRQLDPSSIVVDGMRSLLEQRLQDCTDDAIETPVRPAADHVALLVAGYGSDSRSAAVDDIATSELGYADDDVARFSYAGGRTPPDEPGGSALTSLLTRDYTADDTFTDLRLHGVALADLVEAAAAARPGAPIDLLAHSQGGIVVRLALLELEERGRLDLLGSVVTIGSPHRGVDLGTGALLADPLVHGLLAPVAEWTNGGVDSDAPSVLQMAETSTVMLELERDGVPDGVDFRTIGAVGDLVVTGDKTTVPGHPAALVDLRGPGAHGDLPGAASTTRELALALAGRDPGCRRFRESVVGAFVPQTISFVENAVLASMVASTPP
ncbi:peptidoglycan DD-metalloendopeptidase family protein [Actinospongicola halichondriae]|uniref:peptidoglycan DD-metalloendopeptidase family protein n=1 Tax=Actinospongicola halichondriae TaxID=3236844 RepID=UPI003D4D50AA